MERFDERDTIFSRMLLEEGSSSYQEYYNRHTHLEAADKVLRTRVPGIYSDMREVQSYIDGTFRQIGRLRPLVHPSPVPPFERGDPVILEETLITQLLALGALEVRACPSREDFFYSVRGRGQSYGKGVKGFYSHSLVIAVEMSKEEIQRAPRPEASMEVVRAYLRAAILAINGADLLAQMGWNALAHIDGESQMVLSSAAQEAGLGEIGYHGLLVHPRKGSRIRLAAITTDFPLSRQRRESMDLLAFCKECRRCIKFCPARAISPQGKTVIHEKCFGQWKKYGTDCGICLKVCPWEDQRNG